MLYNVISEKNLDQVCADLAEAVPAHKFGLIAIHDLRETMAKKGVDFDRECRVFEVCNPHHAKTVLDEDIRVNLALPCRIGVWNEDGRTKVGTLLPTQLLGVFGSSDKMTATAAEVETVMLAIIDDVI